MMISLSCVEMQDIYLYVVS